MCYNIKKQAYNAESEKIMTRDKRIEIAKEAIENHKKVYYNNGEYVNADFWDFAEIFEIILDAYENFGGDEYVKMFEEMYDHAISAYGKTWEHNPYNDDIMWLCIALTRAYLFTGEKKYLDSAVVNFDLTWERAYSEELGGGLFWRVENRSKNTCVNCPGSIAASLIAIATGNASYTEKAKLANEWTAKYMFEPDTGKIYDCIGLDGRINKWSSTYNQGTFVGSSMLLYEATGEEKYLERANAAASYVKGEMYHSGIMNNEEPGNDLPGFKGILARWIYRYALKTNKIEYIDWLRENAISAWNNRNEKGLMWTQLGVKTEDDKEYDVFSMSAAVSVLVNSI